MASFNQYQFDDLLVRDEDVYAQTKYEMILAVLKDSGILTILNAGCGSGELSFLLAAAGHKVVGIDPSFEYIALAEKRCPNQLSAQCNFLVSSIETLPITEQYDCIIATDVLEHIEDHVTAIQKLVRLIKPGGTLIITVPALAFLFGYHDELLGHYRRYNRANLNFLIKKNNDITVSSIRYFGFTLIPICYLYSKILRRPYPVAPKNLGIMATIRQRIIMFILRLDRHLPIPLGISLLAIGRKNF
ncbi:MAG: hypothetical protein A2821_03010 [Candidatus Magasanikbacteria bacterium RIFCSPHIGHO2_01_FULL_41_23]|uniref:Methyltransferase type 11 domain-containing protein n=1 Tax=Candidatus Magasanikbacteria bacterium RIFCSPLOWO2_01_FULL_40_15 TaxID=1798686 RepID=A0A1F6N3L3_9BACT|nr:MAG: hypothetical protein A2821_03010 [Candidatus Magasanikbacteria bacterium RIFCSPHIGHO2_01_FULL_41_23]OGH67308.1 MAG: hypothetical protein A3C66_01025 [Candidatus Magasanikbacteria bacterium RIFCSPHIGHO2_02_FULL_41_35]OGH76533.1 MAG: hypothetical protein A3F22_00235 [Candidatus Magasanikbacteria bacterium RIFCSPHIGHO2_12_FULL_41_16]OGH78481.1 MAG: hypothetical protein A2983_03120 [Candidatus Magasanikbacteria bacterium RIFCSPLOWO2_01_FULL_40_15]